MDHSFGSAVDRTNTMNSFIHKNNGPHDERQDRFVEYLRSNMTDDIFKSIVASIDQMIDNKVELKIKEITNK